MGGMVRDLLIGKLEASADIDWLIPESSKPMSLARELAAELNGHFVPLHAELGTARVVFDNSDGTRSIVDLVELRAPTITEDLLLHDYTINSMALEPEHLISGAVLDNPDLVIDPTHGRTDLEAGLVRVINEESFLADPLRMLRGIRMVAKFQFELEQETANLIRKHARLILTPSPERIRDELVKILAHPNSVRYLRMMADLGLLFYIFPEVEESTEPLERVTAMEQVIAQSSPDVLALLDTPLVMGAGKERSRRVMLVLAALLAHAGAEGAMAALERLRLSRNEIRTAGISLRLLPVLDMLYAAGGGTRADRWAFYQAAGEDSLAAVLLWLALHGDEADRRIFIEAVLHERPMMMTTAPLITGNDLQQVFKINPGPQIKELLDQVRIAQFNGQINTRDEALAYVSSLLREQGPQE